MTAAWHCPYTPYEPSVQIETDDSERILIWTRFTHVCPAESRGAPHPGGSLPNLHSAGLYGSEKDGNTKTYLEVNRRRKTEGRKQREIKIKKSYDIRQRLAQDIIWDFMSHQRERKLTWQKRICYKKKNRGKKEGNTALRKFHRWAMMLCMREGSWWATKQTVGLHHCNCNSTYTLKSRSHEVFLAFDFSASNEAKMKPGARRDETKFKNLPGPHQR